MLRTSAWAYRKSASRSARICPDSQSCTRRLNSVMAMMRRTNTTVIAALPTLIFYPGQAAGRPVLSTSSADRRLSPKGGPPTPTHLADRPPDRRKPDHIEHASPSAFRPVYRNRLLDSSAPHGPVVSTSTPRLSHEPEVGQPRECALIHTIDPAVHEERPALVARLEVVRQSWRVRPRA